MSVMVKRSLLIVSSVVVAVLLSAVWSWVALYRFQNPPVSNGPWKTNLAVGGQNADLYLRARIAVFGLWALNSSETVYFAANTDSAGQPLDPTCTYTITGNDVDTRWWSVTAYGDFHFIPNPDNRYSFSQTAIVREADSTWTVTLSPKKQGKNWLPTSAKAGSLGLSFRCYNPSAAFVQHIETAPLPTITRIVCP